MSLADPILDALAVFPAWLVVLVVSALPVVELRGGIPIGILSYDLPWWEVFGLAVLGNLIPVPFILVLMRPVEHVLRRVGWIDRLLSRLFDQTLRRTSEHVKRYEAMGLAVFVAVPLPVTGAWTGALAAYLLNLGFRRSVLAIGLGVLAAATIVTLIVVTGRAAFLLL